VVPVWPKATKLLHECKGLSVAVSSQFTSVRFLGFLGESNNRRKRSKIPFLAGHTICYRWTVFPSLKTYGLKIIPRAFRVFEGDWVMASCTQCRIVIVAKNGIIFYAILFDLE
jgi:hypothetical protein